MAAESRLTPWDKLKSGALVLALVTSVVLLALSLLVQTHSRPRELKRPDAQTPTKQQPIHRALSRPNSRPLCLRATVPGEMARIS